MDSRKIMSFKRRRLGLTDYKKRISLLKSGKLRLVVRKTNKRIITQIIKFNLKGDEVLLEVSSDELSEHGWKHSFKNLPASYLTGFLMGKKALENDFNDLIIDFGRESVTKGGKIFAVLKGAADAGLEFPFSDDKFPTEDRIKGKHIEEYFEKNEDNFSKDNPKKISDDFDKVLKKLKK